MPYFHPYAAAAWQSHNSVWQRCSMAVTHPALSAVATFLFLVFTSSIADARTVCRTEPHSGKRVCADTTVGAVGPVSKIDRPSHGNSDPASPTCDVSLQDKSGCGVDGSGNVADPRAPDAATSASQAQRPVPKRK